MRDFGKVHTQFWESTKIRGLSEDARYLAIYLLSCPHGTIAGVFRLPDGYACEDLQWTSKRVSEGFKELFQKGFANRCETTKWVWVCKHFEWNPLENPNQRKSAVKVADQIPDECDWKPAFMRVCGPLLGIQAPDFDNPLETLSEGFLNQEQEKEKEKEKEIREPNGSVGKADPIPPCPTQDLIDLFHEVLPELPAVRLLNDKRKKSISAMWRWVLTSRKTDNTRRAETAEQAKAWFREYFDRARDNDFLMGRGQRSGDHANWVCDIDFLMTDRGLKHVIEKTRVAA
ncbi:hypothetical protein PSQ40_04810 [Curvibacter sp. HBC61]|uniref:Uncharacterized protein n=1 Tax=Curvibacter cyanobacteriorum TaxID=3026422 RepID=A0ABT5MV15_9BURK|nr:hypothetical protein [Curvibacter sp. HBC61]MDD0837886.1 hypothetical protein [Curvibacter sp. HBC61]